MRWGSSWVVLLFLVWGCSSTGSTRRSTNDSGAAGSDAAAAGSGGTAGPDGSATGGGSGAGGSAGTPGSGGSAGTSGSGGSAGIDGGAGASASGGADGGLPDPPACPATTFLDEDKLAVATVLLDSCVSDDGFWRTQNELRGTMEEPWYPGTPALVDCLANVTNGCVGVSACFGYSPYTNQTCGTCNGNVAVYCGSGGSFLWDCDKLGLTCNAGWCLPPGDQACTDQNFNDHCSAQGQPLHCQGLRVHVGPTCADYGLVCKVGGMTLCTGVGPLCYGPSSPYFDIQYVGKSCQGSVMDACVGGAVGRMAKLDCSCLGPGFSCQSAEGATFCGAGSECDPETHAKTCNGTSVVFCDAGKLRSVDCTALGFSSCNPDAGFGCQ